MLEGAWKAAPLAERDLWQGLAQLAVGLTHLQRGNGAGAEALLRRAASRLEGFAGGTPYDLAVDALIRYARRTADALAGGEQPVTPPALRIPGAARG